jgi:aminomethyltransferase
MPVSYTGINEEHLAVMNYARVFDVSPMGEFILKVEYALELLAKGNDK